MTLGKAWTPTWHCSTSTRACPPTPFETLLACHHGVVIAGSGLGHVSTDMVKAIEDGDKGGIQVVMTSQCLYGRVNLNVYYTGRDLITAGVIPGEDMLPETAYVKLMWVLGQTSDDDEVRRLMINQPPRRDHGKEGDRWLSRLTCGIEIHQQLSTKKLFCSCETRSGGGRGVDVAAAAQADAVRDGGDRPRRRWHRPTGRCASAIRRPSRGRCLVDADEEPPHDANKDAVDVSLTCQR